MAKPDHELEDTPQVRMEMNLFDTTLALHRRGYACGVGTFWEDGLYVWTGVLPDKQQLEFFDLSDITNAAQWLKEKAWDNAYIDAGILYSRSSARLFSSFRKLHDNEVNCGVQVGTGKAIEVWIGDIFNGIAERGAVADLREAAAWLNGHAEKYYAVRVATTV